MGDIRDLGAQCVREQYHLQEMIKHHISAQLKLQAEIHEHLTSAAVVDDIGHGSGGGAGSEGSEGNSRDDSGQNGSGGGEKIAGDALCMGGLGDAAGDESAATASASAADEDGMSFLDSAGLKQERP